MTPRFFSRTAVVVWIAALAGVLCVMPYINVLRPLALQAAASRYGIPVYQVVLLSLLQNLVVLGLMTFTGLWAARKVGMGAPLLDAWLYKSPVSFDVRRSALVAAILGIACGAIVIVLDVFVFMPHGPHITNIPMPPAWTGLLASVEGGLTEEVELRLFLLSFVALGLCYLVDLVHGNRTAPLPAGIFWTANIIAAVLFGLGHLPMTAHLIHITPLIVVRAVALNGILGVVAGYLFWRRGIEMAMVCHFSADIMLHVVTPFIAPHLVASGALQH